MRRINTARGVYTVRIAAEPESMGEAVGLTIVLERVDGVERVALRCIVPAARMPADYLDHPENIQAQLEQWVIAGFEQIREAALKSIRSAGQMWEARFIDAPGPWRIA